MHVRAAYDRCVMRICIPVCPMLLMMLLCISRNQKLHQQQQRIAFMALHNGAQIQSLIKRIGKEGNPSFILTTALLLLWLI